MDEISAGIELIENGVVQAQNSQKKPPTPKTTLKKNFANQELGAWRVAYRYNMFFF